MALSYDKDGNVIRFPTMMECKLCKEIVEHHQDENSGGFFHKDCPIMQRPIDATDGNEILTRLFDRTGYVLKQLGCFTIEELQKYIIASDEEYIYDIVDHFLEVGMIEKDENNLYTWIGKEDY